MGMTENCREKIVSEKYVDFIWKSSWSPNGLESFFPEVCFQMINDFYDIYYVSREYLETRSRTDYEYEVFPKLYGLLENESLEASRILQIQNHPVLQLKGAGVILGFLDTGIDYTNPCFRNSVGKSRILEIWDQSIQTGSTPAGIDYGSIYGREIINQALESDIPFSIVPSRDEIGHGTQLAAIAAGSLDKETGWVGAAPLADIAVVKLKPAKGYLKQYFGVKADVIAYQENDIMLGLRYLHELALRERKPLVVCIGLGTNMGGHEGTCPLASYISAIGSRVGRCIVVAGGNEANQGHHFYGMLKDGQEYEDVEFRVADGEYGITMELWGSSPDVLSVSLISPTGEMIPRLSARSGNQRFDFIFEKTVIYIDFQPVEAQSGDQLIVIRMFFPMPGIWRLRVYGTNVLRRIFNIWLPVTGFIAEGTKFLSPNPDITLTGPSNAEIPITVGAYHVQNKSLYISSSRGFTRRGRIKPDLIAAGVDVKTIGPENRSVSMTGTSIAASVTAGSAALILEWGIVRGNWPTMSSLEIKQLLIRGANRSNNELYPNRSWGYGTLNLYSAFEALTRF
ncbi:S8 family peptidase [Faecalicatena orotica]|nr:S8 family peptidase [Faecalicatena orotica]